MCSLWLFWFFFVSLQSSNCCFVGIFFLPEELSKTPTLFSKVKALTWCDLHVVFLSYYLVLFSLFWFLLSVHLSPCFFFYHLLSFMVLLSYPTSCAESSFPRSCDRKLVGTWSMRCWCMKFTPTHWQELRYLSLVGMFGAYEYCMRRWYRCISIYGQEAWGVKTEPSASWIRRRNPKVFGCCDLLGKQEIQLPPTELRTLWAYKATTRDIACLSADVNLQIHD